jgi:hypothetical protein
MKRAALALAILLFPAFTFAEMPAEIYSVEVISKSSGTLRGYLVLPLAGPLDASTPETLSFVRKQRNPMFLYETISETAKMPTGGAFRITTKKPLEISGADIRALKALNWPLNGKDLGDPPPVVSKEQAALLKKQPLGFCASKIWDCDYWISYNPGVNSSRLEKLCNKRPSESEQQEILQMGEVIHLAIFCD